MRAPDPRLHPGRTAGATLALCILATQAIAGAPASAQQQKLVSESIEELELSVEAICPWPSRLYKGYAPILVRVENHGGRDRTVDLVASAGGTSSSHAVLGRARVEAGESAEVELTVPAFSEHYATWSLEVAVGGGNRRHLQGIAGVGQRDEWVSPVVLLTDQPLEAGAQERLSDDLGLEAIKTMAERKIEVAAVTFDRAPRRLESYSSLDLVIVDTEAGLPPDELMDVLARWARLGGTVAFLGPRADEISSTPWFEPWTEERMRSWTGRGGEFHVCGLGGVYAAKTAGLGESADLGFSPRVDLKRILRYETTFAPTPFPEEELGWRIEIPGIGKLPHRVFLLALIVFVVLVGPVNFIVLKRRGKQALVLLTVPALSLLAALGLLAYGLLYQGLSVKTASRSYTVLDQRQHVASTAEHRSLYAGLTPGGGLQPQDGTLCLPAVEGEGSDEPRHFGVDLRKGVRLTGGFVPSRQRIWQTLLSDRTARGRLSFTPHGDSWSVENGLGAKVTNLVLRDADGDWHELFGTLEAGGSGVLLRQAPEKGVSHSSKIVQEMRKTGRSMRRKEAHSLEQVPTLTSPHGHVYVAATGPTDPNERVFVTVFPKRTRILRLEELPPSCYAATLERNPFADDCGLDSEELGGHHCLLGILAEDEEAW